MAERRMISKSMLMDNDFLNLSNDEKSLYLYLLMFADDDGFVKRSIMIDSVLKVSDNDYKVLENKGLIISENDEIKVITHWNTLETIREKLYTPTVYLDFRSQLFLKVDFSYTKNPKEARVFTNADNWVKQGRPKNIQNFEPLIQQHLREVQSKHSLNTAPVQDKDGTSASPDKNSIDKSSKDKTSTGQQRSDKATSSSTTTLPSNGGMGEVSSSTATSTSTIDNNATRENGVDSEVTFDSSNSSISNYQDETEFLLDYINSRFTGEVHAESSERLTTLLADLQNEYQAQYIQQGIDKLVDQVGSNYNASQVPPLFINHLAGAVKEVVSNQ